MEILISSAYVLLLSGLTIFGLQRLSLVWLLWRTQPPTPPGAPSSWPHVLVQLPVFNERNVVERLIRAVAALDYPPERLEVQVLDDSNDETQALVKEQVAWYRKLGLSIEQLRRPQREGFKAGALAHGLQESQSELIAIFDADFLPAPDFLRRTVPYFQDPGLGLVQARWGHLNRGRNLLTRIEALALDAHFRVEQAARSRSGRFFNFNGTAGVFRRAAIEAAGGWESDTLTEDLDLSLRAQLCGWRFRYLDEVVAPAELPEELSAFRTQQERWTRGAGQTARKLLREVWRTSQISLAARTEASFQLLLNLAYPLLFLLSLLTVPLVLIGSEGPLRVAQWTLCVLASGSVALFYVVSQRSRGWGGMLEAFLLTPLLFACGIGMSLSNGVAYLRGLGGSQAVFLRTPKVGEARAARYPALSSRDLGALELLIGIYAFSGLFMGLWEGSFLALPFLTLVGVGFSAIGVGSLFPGAHGSRENAGKPALTRTPKRTPCRPLSS